MCQFTLQSYQSTATDCPVCGKSFDSMKAFGPHFSSKHPDKIPTLERVRRDFAPSPEKTLRMLHHDLGLAVRTISDRFGYPRDGLSETFEQLEIDRRKWDIGDWYDEEPERALEHAQRVAGLGADAREENGMAGVTGQDNPNWRGGKNILDAVKKQLHPSWWTVRDDNRAQECHKCGASDCKLDVHHIVPIMSGGTNEPWNLMTLCESCHIEAEWYTRQYGEFDPVLVG